jgi:hypothetical protein
MIKETKNNVLFVLILFQTMSRNDNAGKKNMASLLSRISKLEGDVLGDLTSRMMEAAKLDEEVQMLKLEVALLRDLAKRTRFLEEDVRLLKAELAQRRETKINTYPYMKETSSFEPN